MGLTWNFFLATKYCMRRMTLMVARWCSRSLRWRKKRREWPPNRHPIPSTSRGEENVQPHGMGDFQAPYWWGRRAGQRQETFN